MKYDTIACGISLVIPLKVTSSWISPYISQPGEIDKPVLLSELARIPIRRLSEYDFTTAQ